MPVLVDKAHALSCPTPLSNVDILSEAAITYVLHVPSGAVLGWLRGGTFLEERRPRTMLQAVTFGVEKDERLRVVRLRPVDESEDDW